MRLLPCLLAVALPLATVGCSGDDAPERSTSTEQSSSASDDPGTGNGSQDGQLTDADAYCAAWEEFRKLDLADMADRPRIKEQFEAMSAASGTALAEKIDFIHRIADEVGVDEDAFNELVEEDPSIAESLIAIQTASIESCGLSDTDASTPG